MELTQRGLVLCLLSLLALLHWAYSEEAKINKRAVGQSAPATGDALLEDSLDDVDKRRIFRYGRGVFRYGKRAPVFRYGKRGSLFRYGKRDDEGVDSYLDDEEWPEEKRIFRYGKRSDTGYKRLFRWGKRSDEDEDSLVAPSEKRRIFRYGKRDDDSFTEELKRKVFRFGKRDDYDALTEEEKRFMDSARDIRAPQDPHVPFRFGDD